MPGFKKLIGNIRLGKEKKAEPCPPEVEDKSPLRRTNARLRKRNGSSINIANALSTVHSSFPIRDGRIVSRQNSFEPGQSVKDFDISPVSRRDWPLIGISRPEPAGEYAVLSQSPGQDAEQSLEPSYQFGAPNSPDIHPINLATAAANSAIQRRSIRSSRSSMNIRPTLHVVNTSPEPIEDSEDDIPSSTVGFARLNRLSRAGLPAIHHLDWSKLSDEEARNIAKAYDAASIMNHSHSSFADSGIAMSMSRSGSGTAYSGKGKSRQRSSSYLSRRLSDAFSDAAEAWYEAQGEIDGGVQLQFEPDAEDIAEPSSNVSRQNTTLDLSDSPLYPDLSQEALEAACKIEIDQLQRDEQILANAWEIESRRYLEQLANRFQQEEEERLQAQIEEENRLLREQEEQERKAHEELQRLEEELLQQALREIEEEEKRAEELRLAEERARMKDCCVCGDSQDRDKFPGKTPAAGCEHPPNTCKECLESWMASEVETKGCDGIICPECPQILEYQEVQEAASAETFAAYDKLTIRNALGSLDEFAWCLKPECGSGQLNIDNNHFMDCVSCGYKQCLRHKVPWHTSETCEQYEYRVSGQKQRDEEKKEEEMLNNLSKKCPGANCGWRIEKIDGCEHMTCKKCKHQFCWICLADHLEIKRIGNTAHDPSCKFHSTNLDLAWPFNMH